MRYCAILWTQGLKSVPVGPCVSPDEMRRHRYPPPGQVGQLQVSQAGGVWGAKMVQCASLAEIAQWLAKMAPSIERTAPQPACSPARGPHSNGSDSASILATGSLDLKAADGQLPSLASIMDGIAPADMMLSTLVSPLSGRNDASLGVLRSDRK